MEKLSSLAIQFYIYEEAVESAKWKHIFFVMLNIIYVQAVGSTFEGWCVCTFFFLNARIYVYTPPHATEGKVIDGSM